ncbi:MAG: hypothetical protein ACYC6Y_02805 [Thermoguttaceae bacterium]
MTYQIYPTSFDDQSTILALWKRNLPTAIAGRYDWLYHEGSANDWLLQDEGRQTIGSVGLMQRNFRIHDRPVTAGQAVDMNVDQAHRSLGPALQLQRKALDASSQLGLPLVYGVCDRRSQLVLQRIGYRLLGDVGRWARPLTSEPFLPPILRRRWLRRSASLLADLALRLGSAESWTRRPKDVRVEVVDRFDHRADELFAHVAGRFSIIGDRSSAYLNWRFADAPAAGYRTLSLCDRQDRLRAYLVYRFCDATAHVADFLYQEPADLAVLLVELLALARRWGMESAVVECLAPDPIASLLNRFGFWRRPSNWPVLVYAPQATEAQWREEGLFDLANWYFTRADVDTDA